MSMTNSGISHINECSYKADILLKYRSCKNPNLTIKLFEIIVPNKRKVLVSSKDISDKTDKTDQKWSRNVMIDDSKKHEPFVLEKIESSENAWKPVKLDITIPKPDIKQITGILNKISKENFEKMLLETLSLNYKHPDIIDLIFTKSVSNVHHSDLYAEYCNRLDLKDLLNEMCLEQFNLKKHKNLCKFIGSLYKIGLITLIDPFTSLLITDLHGMINGITNLELLLELIKTIGPENKEFVFILKHLDAIKETFSVRLKFAIMDVLDKVPKKKRVN